MDPQVQLSTRLVGFVRIAVGADVHDVPICAAPFARDTGGVPGGFFLDERGEAGILVQEGASPDELRVQIERATGDVVRHFTRRTLN